MPQRRRSLTGLWRCCILSGSRLPSRRFTVSVRLTPRALWRIGGWRPSLLGNPFAWPPTPGTLKEGWEAVTKAKALAAPTPREQGYVAAIEAFYKEG